jgi:hypothetical protein
LANSAILFGGFFSQLVLNEIGFGKRKGNNGLAGFFKEWGGRLEWICSFFGGLNQWKRVEGVLDGLAEKAIGPKVAVPQWKGHRADWWDENEVKGNRRRVVQLSTQILLISFIYSPPLFPLRPHHQFISAQPPPPGMMLRMALEGEEKQENPPLFLRFSSFSLFLGRIPPLIYAHSRTPRMNELKEGKKKEWEGMPAGPTGDFQPASAEIFPHSGTANQRKGRKDRSKPPMKREERGKKLTTKGWKQREELRGGTPNIIAAGTVVGVLGRMDGCQSTADAPKTQQKKKTKHNIWLVDCIFGHHQWQKWNFGWKYKNKREKNKN